MSDRFRCQNESGRGRMLSAGLVLCLLLSALPGFAPSGGAAGVLWDPEVVDAVGDAGHGRISIVLDPGGGVHISYHRAADGDLMYAHKLPDGSWKVERVASDGDVGYDSSIAVDGSGGVHIAYLDRGNGNLSHAYRPLGGGWTTEEVDTEGRLGGLSISLAIDSQDGLHVTYSEGVSTKDQMKYAHRPSVGGWSVDIVGSGLFDDYQDTRLIVDVSDTLHCLYVRRHAGLEPYGTYLDYMSKSLTGQWVKSEGVHAVEDWMPMSFAMDGQGGLHASYHTYRGNTQYHYAHRPKDGEWSDEVLFGPAGETGSSSIAVDGEGRAHLVYYNGTVKDLGYGYRLDNGTWTDLTVASAGRVGRFNALAMDVDDRAHVLYYDETGQRLMYIARATRPSRPQGLEAQPGDGNVTLVWEAPEDSGLAPVNGYRVYEGSEPGEPVLVAELGPVNEHTLTGLESGTVYHYTVVAVTDLGESPPSTPASASPRGPPGAPRNVTATPGDGVVDLSWLSPRSDGGYPITGYRVFRGTTGGQVAFHRSVEGATALSDTSLENGVTYNYSVSAVNEAGEGERSQEVSATPLAPPSAPLLLMATTGDGFVALVWSAPVDDGGSKVTRYRVYRSLVPGSPGLLQEVEVFTRFKDTGVTNGVTYYYSVSAVNALGEGERTPELETTPLAPPSVPRGVNLTAGDGLVELSWSPPEDDGGTPITGYRVYKGPEGQEEFLRELEPTTRFNDTEVVNGQIYHYRVSAVNAVGEGRLSAGLGAMPVGPPTRPPQLELETVEDLVVLNWTIPESDGGAEITGFVVLRGTSQDELEPVAEVGLVLNYTDSSIERGKRYYYSVAAKNRVGVGEQADVVDVRLEQQVGGFVPGPAATVLLLALGIAALVAGARRRR